MKVVIGLLELDNLCLQLDELLVLLLEGVHLQLRLQAHDLPLQRTDLLVLDPARHGQILLLTCQLIIFCG